jgi:alpha-galactosidase
MNLRHSLFAGGIILTVAFTSALRGEEIPAELSGSDAPAGSVWVDSLDLKNAEQAYGVTRAGISIDGNKLTLGGKTYAHGIGTHAQGRLIVNLHGAATKFEALVGVDDERKGLGSVIFTLLVDGHKAAESPVLHGGDKPQLISADLTGAQRLVLYTGDAGDGNRDDHADWAGALITLASGAPGKPASVAIVPRLKMPTSDPRTAIHGARIIGSTPGHPFIFSISATGSAPLAFAAENLPAGLKLDEKTGIITGSLQAAGRTEVKLTVSGSGGTAHRVLTIVGGDHMLALTPPMGWNSWNVWGITVDESKVKAAADEMISAGLQAHGYQFVNIDDGWQLKVPNPNPRDAQGRVLANSQFPDMKRLSDFVHAKGLRIGIYSSPGPATCGGYTGSYQHEEQDAQTYADWGFDYLKYDWCSYGGIPHANDSLAEQQKPYQVMRAALNKVPRDIVYSLCQYGMGDVWNWGHDPSVLANCWRTHGDILDRWKGDGGVWDIVQAEVGHEKFAGPGHWNDPDMLMVGIVGFGNTHPTGLTPDEQISHISMWCLLSSPLLIGCDMTRLDPFTLAILTNDEAIDINQDPLGHTASLVHKDDHAGEVWARPLSDGTWAVGLLNGGMDEAKLTARWSDVGITGRQKVRDLWLHQNVGTFDDSYSVMVPSHGTALLKIGTPRE